MKNTEPTGQSWETEFEYILETAGFTPSTQELIDIWLHPFIEDIIKAEREEAIQEFAEKVKEEIINASVTGGRVEETI